MSEYDLMTRESETGSAHNLINRFWDDLVGRAGSQSRTLRPSVDVSETDNDVTVAIELPGLSKDDVKLTIEDGVLHVSGEKKFEQAKDEGDEGRTWHRIERYYGAFQRSVVLPRGVDAARADAEFKDGVLTVRLPKTEDVKPRQLKIK